MFDFKPIQFKMMISRAIQTSSSLIANQGYVEHILLNLHSLLIKWSLIINSFNFLSFILLLHSSFLHDFEDSKNHSSFQCQINFNFLILCLLMARFFLQYIMLYFCFCFLFSGFILIIYVTNLGIIIALIKKVFVYLDL